MENENLSAVTTDEAVEVTTNETDEDIVLADGDDGEVDAKFTDTETEEEVKKTETEETKGKEEKPKQSKEQNKAFAEKRRAEKNLKEEAELKVLKEYVGKNPYTNEPIETLRDVKVYKTMKQIDKDGGDPLMDYHKYAGLEEQKALDNEKAKTENVKNDVKDFINAYPKVDLNELRKDDNFVQFSNKMIGKVPLKDIYEAYESLSGGLKTKAEESAKQEIAKKIAKEQTSVGNLATSGDAGAPKYTMEQIGKMSKAELNSDWDNVEKSYDYWLKHKK